MEEELGAGAGELGTLGSGGGIPGHGDGVDAAAAGIGRGHGRGSAAPNSLDAMEQRPVGVGRGRGAPTSNRPNVSIGKRKFVTRDLKSFYSVTGSVGSSSGPSGSSRRPSTRESQNANVAEVESKTVVQNQEQVQSLVDDAEEPLPEVGAEQAEDNWEEEDHGGTDLIREFDPNVHIISDPGLRIPIASFHPNIRDDVKRAYLLRGPIQLKGHSFPRINGRAFRKDWFDNYDWLEYSVSKDAAYCFYCFLFRKEADHEKFGHEVFSKTGYDNWKHAAARGFPDHCRAVNGCHNKARKCADDFKNQRASVARKIESNTLTSEQRYEARITAAIDIARFLIAQGLAFRGHDESDTSLNRGNFLEMLEWHKRRDPKVKTAFDHLCPKNARTQCPKIQKDITDSCAKEISKVIKEEIGDNLFSILIDESRDVSIVEQMTVVVRFVNKQGMVVERFLGLKHVEDTTSLSLKRSLLEMLGKYGLSVGRLRGQGYDGASNMRGEFNGLQKQIRDENPYAFYIHCFAHQLQLVIVSVTSSCSSFDDFFNYVSLIVSSTSSSCKRKDKLIAKHREEILERLESGSILSGKGKHQTTNLVRAGETRWGSHLRTLSRIELMWNSVVKVLSMIHEDERNTSRAGGLVRKMESFSFVLNMKLMLKVLRITNELSLLLQKKDQNIVQAMSLLIDVRTRLLTLRNEGWQPLLDEVISFCNDKKIPVPNMNEAIPRWGRSRLDGNLITQEHHYRVDTFLAALDAIISEMDHRFNEVSSELLVSFACLDPRDSFAKFDIEKIARLTEIYDQDFSDNERSYIREQLQTFVIHMRRVDLFKDCHDLQSLAVQMVKHERDIAFPLVFRLIKLALLLPVATASVERAFSAMNIIKTDLRNRMNDEWLNSLILCYIEKQIFRDLDSEEIKKTFQATKNRRIDLPRPPRKPRLE